MPSAPAKPAPTSPHARAHDALLLGRARLVADRSGALVWPERETVIVADLHLEKGSSFARRGQLLPPYDTSATLARLEAVLTRHRPKRVISLGDGFHDAEASGRLAPADAARLRVMITAHEWIWVLGNHDPEPPRGFEGRIAPMLEMGGLVFRHQPGGDPGPTHEVAGHLHPAARIRVRGRGMTRPCFVSDRRRIVLPAFGAFTGGLDIHDAAIACLFHEPPAVRMLGRDGVYLVRDLGKKNEAAGGPPRAEETETLRKVHLKASQDGCL